MSNEELAVELKRRMDIEDKEITSLSAQLKGIEVKLKYHKHHRETLSSLHLALTLRRD